MLQAGHDGLTVPLPEFSIDVAVKAVRVRPVSLEPKFSYGSQGAHEEGKGVFPYGQVMLDDTLFLYCVGTANSPFFSFSQLLAILPQQPFHASCYK